MGPVLLLIRRRLDIKPGRVFLNQESKYGACVVGHDAATINRIVVEEFLKQGVEVMGVSPHDLMFSIKGELGQIWLGQIREMLRVGIVPIVHGDVLIDGNQGVSIFSCDKVLTVVASGLGLSGWKEVFFVSAADFPGVLDKQGRLVKQITPKILDKLDKDKAFDRE